MEIPPAVHKWSQKWLSLLPVQKTSTSVWCFTSWVCLGISRWQRMSNNFHDLAAHLGTSWFNFHSDVDPVKRSFWNHSRIWDSQGEKKIFWSSRQKKTECYSLICKKLRQITNFKALFPTSCSHFTQGFLEAECCLSGQQFYSFLMCTFVWTTVIEITAKYQSLFLQCN